MTESSAELGNAERLRLAEDARTNGVWKRWGPYLSERQWGTVREDYSPYGTAWEYLPHDAARSRAYRWGEDGIAGISDDRQLLCLAVALWNGRDPILKERLFGLTNSEGNHGEDVKELYYYLDATPTHSYQRMLYKYPQEPFPYSRLVDENRRRDRADPELELIDTGIFDEGRYFDVVVEYAKAAPNDILLRVTVHNRGPEAASIHVLPQVWFRNTWSWSDGAPRPALHAIDQRAIEARHPDLGRYVLHCDPGATLLFCDNDTNTPRLFGSDAPGYFKDAFHEYVVDGRHDAVNPRRAGTKAAAHYLLAVPAGGAAQVRLRLSDAPSLPRPFTEFDAIVASRQREADEFYAVLQRDLPDAEKRNVQRQALAGLLWSKQFYHYDVPEWLRGDPAQPPPPPERRHGRNHEWQHLNNADVVSMPDTWEYPWYAAWDLAFHCIPLALVDAEFAKSQLVLLLREWYMHPNGQLPAYEWALGDVNPPVHAWAAWRVFEIDRRQRGDAGDIAFLERVLHKLMLNFTWWVNRKDLGGHNIFQGGFLGLDNVGVFDRSKPLPTGGHINQSDGTSWMAMYSLNLLRIALELAQHNPVYEDIATKFFEHFLEIAAAMSGVAGDGPGLWDETDEFYYDVLKLPDGARVPLRLRSMVGLIPLFAVETLEPELLDRVPEFRQRLEWFLHHRPDLARQVSRWNEPGRGERRLLSLLRGHRMKCLLRRMLDETEFLSEYGVRSLSRHHRDVPYVLSDGDRSFGVRYEPAESESGLFGGNSNWRGPVWFPVNFLLVESLQKFHHYYGDEFRVEYPTGSGVLVTLNDVADELTRRLTRLFLRDADGRRPSARQHGPLANDPHFRDHVLFHEYFDGDDGRGLGASHQTGWTALVAKLLQPRRAPH
ncbi:Glycoside hydrolase, family 63 (plasmid) [Gemmatirosa kalamazoonensis]|uniref:Glycoside hydrolase, family 63 n=1 Tax=Gemmatirosa kalamazoonensis TaxID=861299 RepID=W0RRY8_9BACT|nr:Glycoside hydrolase, family 63 [Gemmatirosa kalamazoonensis]